MQQEKWWFDKDFEFYFGAMFECGDYEKLLSKIDSILQEHKERIIKEIEGKRLALKHDKECPYKRPGCDCGFEQKMAYNAALDAVINHLKKGI